LIAGDFERVKVETAFLKALLIGADLNGLHLVAEYAFWNFCIGNFVSFLKLMLDVECTEILSIVNFAFSSLN
jgi:hypothetical protein